MHSDDKQNNNSNKRRNYKPRPRPLEGRHTFFFSTVWKPSSSLALEGSFAAGCLAAGDAGRAGAATPPSASFSAILARQPPSLARTPGRYLDAAAGGAGLSDRGGDATSGRDGGIGPLRLQGSPETVGGARGGAAA